MEDESDAIGLRVHLTEESCLAPSELGLERLELALRAMAERVDFDDRELVVGLHLCGDEEMAQLHQQFMGKDSSTDVMAFEPDEFLEDYLGDVVVCWDVARKESEGREHDAMAECWFYILHGVLHLMGFDDKSPEQRQIMHEHQVQALLTQGIEVSLND